MGVSEEDFNKAKFVVYLNHYAIAVALNIEHHALTTDNACCSVTRFDVK